MAFVCGMEGTNLCRCACAPQLELRLPWTNAEMRPAPASAMALTVAMLAFASCEVVVFPLVVGLARLAEVLASSSRLLRRALSLPSSSVRLLMPSAASSTKLPGSWTVPPPHLDDHLPVAIGVPFVQHRCRRNNAGGCHAGACLHGGCCLPAGSVGYGLAGGVGAHVRVMRSTARRAYHRQSGSCHVVVRHHCQSLKSRLFCALICVAGG